jgi:hypothetical protein
VDVAAAGYYTRRTAGAWLSDVLDQARRGTLAGMVWTGATLADAAAEECAGPSTTARASRRPGATISRSSAPHILPAFGAKRLEDIATEGVERWAARLTAGGRMNNRTKLRVLTVLHGVTKRARRVWKLSHNHVTDVEKPVQTHRTTIDVFSSKTSWLSRAPPGLSKRRELPHRRLRWPPAPRRARRSAMARRRHRSPAPSARRRAPHAKGPRAQRTSRPAHLIRGWAGARPAGLLCIAVLVLALAVHR